MRTRIVVLLVIVGLVSMSCGSGGDDKYKQTWTKAYSETTCVDWNGSAMDQRQRFVMAADMLVSARNSDRADSDLPEDSLINQFRDGITQLCQADVGFSASEKKIASLASLVYTTDRPRFGP